MADGDAKALGGVGNGLGLAAALFLLLGTDGGEGGEFIRRVHRDAVQIFR